jgi:hypothetical protein
MISPTGIICCVLRIVMPVVVWHKMSMFCLRERVPNLSFFTWVVFMAKITTYHMDDICCELIGFQLLSERMNLGCHCRDDINFMHPNSLLWCTPFIRPLIIVHGHLLQQIVCIILWLTHKSITWSCLNQCSYGNIQSIIENINLHPLRQSMVRGIMISLISLIQWFTLKLGEIWDFNVHLCCLS